MAYLSASNIVQEFSGVRVLNDVGIDIELGKFHILAGENGAGKSTLVKILTGVQSPKSGKLRIDGHDPWQEPNFFDRIAYVPQELSLFSNLTVAENLFIPFNKTGHSGTVFDKRRLEREAQTLVERFSIAARPSQKVSDISVSDRQLVQIARAAARTRFKILILDEPTSSLTSFETHKLFTLLRRLAAEDHGIVFISHKMEEIFELGDHVTVLRNGNLVGNGQLAELDDHELIRLMAGTEVPSEHAFQPATAPGEVLLTVEGLTGPGFEDVSFQLRRGEILGFAGLVGAGRSEVMQAAFGYRRRRVGRVVLCGRTIRADSPHEAVERGLIYLPEERSLHGIFAGLSLYDNIALPLFNRTSRMGLISRDRERAAVRNVVESFDVKSTSTDQLIRFLSGGNQQKAVIGRAIAREPTVLIFDEPTKGIDVRTKGQIYRTMRELAERGIGIILVSSDLTELRLCATRVVTMYAGRVSGDFTSGDLGQGALVSAICGRQGVGHVDTTDR